MLSLLCVRAIMWPRFFGRYSASQMNNQNYLQDSFQPTGLNTIPSPAAHYNNLAPFPSRFALNSPFVYGRFQDFNTPVHLQQHRAIWTVIHPPIHTESMRSVSPLPQQTCPGTMASHYYSSDAQGEEQFKRKWVTTSTKHKVSQPKKGWTRLTVASYNVLAQKLLEDHAHMYNSCERQYLMWDHRRENLLIEIKQHAPDILCMQEVQHNHYEDWFKPKLSELGYLGEYMKRSGDKVDGCATFYNSKKLELDKSSFVEYFKSNVPVLNRDNIGLVLLLKSTGTTTDTRICVANTHLLFNPKRGDVKLAQLQVLFSEIDKIAYRIESKERCLDSHTPSMPSYHPIILCGDFNSLPMSNLYEFIRKGRLEYVGLPQKMISGQDGQRSTTPKLSSPILPPGLGISDQCQLTETFKHRLNLVASGCVNTQEIQLRQLHDMHLTERQSHREPEDSKSRKRSTHQPLVAKNKKKRSVDELHASDSNVHDCSCGTSHEHRHTHSDKSCSSLQGQHRNHQKGKYSNTDPQTIAIPKHELRVHKNDSSDKECAHTQDGHSEARDSAELTDTERQYCSQGSGTLSHAFSFGSVYEHDRHSHGKWCKEVTTCHDRANCTVDYIFYHRGSISQDNRFALKLVERYELYTDEDMTYIGTLPQQHLSSDHMMLMGAFHWRDDDM